MARFLHIADLHLDTPFTGSGFSRDQVLARRRDLPAVLRDAALTAREKQADALLVAGDLFEEEYLNPGTLQRAYAIFAELAPRPVVIAPGNHDPAHPASPYITEEAPRNVRIFRDDRVTKLELPAVGADIYGLAMTRGRETRELLRGFRVEGGPRIKILLCHGAAYRGDPGQAKDYHPINVGSLKESGADYCALGHYHRALAVWRDARGLRAAYPGCPEPLRFGRTGDHGALLVDIVTPGGGLVDKSLVLQKRRCHQIECDLSRCDTVAAIDNEIRSALNKPELEGDLVELTLSGSVPPDALFDPADYADCAAHIFALRLNNATHPAYDFAAISNERSPRGAFCKRMLGEIESAEDAGRRSVREEALRLGLAAFDGRNVEDFPL